MWKKIFGLFVIAGPLIAQVIVNGRIADQEDKPVISALIKVEPSSQALAQEIRSDKNGQFTLNFDLPGGVYFLSISHPDFQETKKEPRELRSGLNIINAILVPIPRFTVDVSPEANKIDIEHAALSEVLDGSSIDSSAVPKAAKLKNVMSSLPGAVLDSAGKLHIDGSPTDQINFLLDSFRANDPVSGELEAKLSAESPQSLDLFSSRYDTALGRGATTMKINTKDGDNIFVRKLTNFLPGIDLNRGFAISSLAPKFTASGPIKKDRVHFFNALDFNFNRNIIHDLPEGQDRINIWDASNMLRLRANLTPRHILTGGFLANYFNAPKSGLSLFNPVSVTTDKRSRRYFFNIQEMFMVSPQTMFALGYARYESFARDVPQGHDIQKLTPSGSSGNAVADIKRWGSRHEFLANVTWRPNEGPLRSHQFRIGTSFNHSTNRQDSRRSGFQHFNLRGLPTTLTTFGGSGRFALSNLESSGYIQHGFTTKLAGWLVHTEAGARFEKDTIIGGGTSAPRFSITFAPPGLEKTKFSAGYGLMPAMTNLGLFGRKLDQYSLNTSFDDNGLPTGLPVLSVFIANEQLLKIPRTSNFSAGLEQKLPAEILLRLDYLRKRGKDGLTFSLSADRKLLDGNLRAQLPPNDIGTIFYLSNERIEVYDALKLIVQKKFREPVIPYFWPKEFNFSAVRSRSASNSNVSPFIDDPIIYSDGSGPTPWDVPSQLKTFGEMGIGKQRKDRASHTVFYYAEWRDGTPFSVSDDYGQQVGRFNSWRLPRYFNLSIHYEISGINFLKRRWALKMGFDNITNHANYMLVNSNIAAPGFPNFHGVEPRKFVIRIRKE